MVSTVASFVLTKVLGDYVEGISEKISVSLGSGDLTLQNLTIKKTAIDQLKLPAQMVSGKIGKLSLKLPWANLSTEPAIIKIEDLFVLLHPRTMDKVDRAGDYNLKMKRLQLDELMGTDKPEVETKEEDKGYFDSLAIKVTENLQIYVDNIHIRYEDSLANPAKPFSLGVTLSQLHIQTCDKNWKPAFLDITEPTIYKLLSLNSFSVYMDTKSNFLKFRDDAEFVNLMQQLIPSKNRALNLQYVVEPIYMQIMASLDKTKKNMTRPYIILDTVIDQVNLCLASCQVKRLLDAQRWYISYWRKLTYQRYEPPSVSLTKDPIQWWAFAIRSISNEIEEKNRKWRWGFILKRREMRKTYIEFYKERKLKPEGFPLDKLKILEKIEEDYDYEDLLSWRKLANASLSIEEEKKKKEKEKSNPIGGWFSGFFSTSKTPITAKETDLAWKELYSLINFEESNAQKSLKFPENYVKTSINIETKKISFVLKDSRFKLIADVSTNLDLSLQLRNNSYALQASMSYFNVNDYKTLDKPLLILSPDLFQITRNMNTSKKLLQISFESKPASQPDVDALVSVSSQPMTFIYSVNTFKALNKFMNYGSTIDIASMSRLAFETVKEQAAVQLKYALDTQFFAVLEMNLNWTVIIPENFTSPNCTTLVVDLGTLKINTDVEENKKRRQKYLSSSQIEVDYFYIDYKATLTGFNVYLTQSWTNWRITGPVPDTFYLIPKFDLGIQIQMRSTKLPLKTIPQFLLQSNLDHVDVFLIPSRVKQLFSILNTISDDMSPPVDYPLPTIDNDHFTDQEDTKIAVVQFAMRMFRINLLQEVLIDGKTTLLPLFEGDFNNMQFITEVNSDNLQLSAQLEAFQLTELTKFKVDNADSVVVKAGSGGGEQKFFVISGQFFNTNSKKTHKASKELQVVVGNIEVLVDRPIISILLYYMNELTVAMDSRPKLTSRPSQQEQLPIIIEKEAVMQANLIVKTSTFSLILRKQGTPFFLASLSRMEVEIEQFDDVIDIKGNLGQFIARDTSDNKWSEFLTHEGSKIAFFQYTMHPPSQAVKLGYQQSFYLDICNARLTFIYSKIMTMMNFIDNFNEMRSTLDYLTKDILPKPEVMKIVVSVRSTTIVVPKNADSMEVLNINLEKAEIKNRLISDLTQNLQMVKWIVEANSLLISTHFMNGIRMESNKLFFLPEASITSVMPISGNEEHKLPEADVLLDISVIEEYVSGDELVFLLQTLNQNFKVNPPEETKEEFADLHKFYFRGRVDNPSKVVPLSASQCLKEIWNTMSVKVLLKNFSLVYQRQLENTRINLMELSIKNFVVTYLEKSDKSFTATLSITNVVAQDAQPKPNKLASPFFSINMLSDATDDTLRAISFNFTSFPTGGSTIYLNMVKPFFVAEPNFLLDVYEHIFLPHFTKIMDNLVAAPTAPPPETDSMEVHLTLASPQIFLIRKFSVLDVKGFIFNLGDWKIKYNVLDKKTAIKIDMSNIDITNALLETSSLRTKSVKHILQHLTISFVSIDTLEKQIIDVVMSEVKLILSYRDVANLVKTYSSWKHFLERMGNVDTSTPRPGATPPPQTNIILSFRMGSFSLLFLDDSTLKEHPIPVIKASTGVIEAKIYSPFETEPEEKKEYVIRKMTPQKQRQSSVPRRIPTSPSDIGNRRKSAVPIVEEKTSLTHSGPLLPVQNKESLYGYAEAKTSQLQIDTYRHTTGEWEPLVEPWSFNVTGSVRKKLTPLGMDDKDTELNLYSNTSFELNVGLGMFEGLGHVFAMLQAQYKDWLGKSTAKTKDDREGRARYWLTIRNDCGLGIIYWYDEKLKNNLEHEQEGPLYVEHTSKNDYFYFSINKTGFEKLRGNWNKEGITIYTGQTCQFILEVKNLYGSRIVTIRTSKSILNSTGSSIDVLVTLGENKLQFKMNPSQKRSIPFNYLEGKIQIRPNDKYQWTNFQDDKPIVSQKLATLNRNWSCNVVSTEDYCTDLRPLLTIQNYLANTLMIKTKDIRNEVHQQDKSIPTGDEASILHPATSEIEFLAISFCLPGFGWSTFENLKPMLPQKSLETKVLLIDNENKKTKFFLHLSIHKVGESVSFIAYTPYWIVNHSQLKLVYRNEKEIIAGQGSAVLYAAENGTFPAYYGPDGTKNVLYVSEPKMSLRVDEETDWSNFFSIDSQTDCLVELPGKSGRKYSLTFSVASAPEKYWRTTVLRIYPSFILYNNTTVPLIFSQTNSTQTTLQPQICVPFHWPQSSLPSTISVYPSKANTHKISPPINLNKLGLFQYYFPPVPAQSNIPPLVFNVEIKLVGVVRYVIFGDISPFEIKIPGNITVDEPLTVPSPSKNEKRWIPSSQELFKVRNNTKLQMYVWEEVTNPLFVDCRSTVPWYWSDPQKDNLTLTIKLVDSATKLSCSKSLKFQKLKLCKPLKIGTSAVSLSISAEGVTRVLLCKYVDPEEDNVNLLNQQPNKKFTVQIPSIGISLITTEPQELVYIYLGNPALHYNSSPSHWAFQFTIEEFQLDNQLYLTPHPVVIYSPKGERNFLEIVVIKDTSYTKIDCFRLVYIVVQQMEVSIDKIFLAHIVEWYNIGSERLKKLVANTEKPHKLINGEVSDFADGKVNKDIIVGSPFLYFEMMQIWPIKITLDVTHSYVDFSNLTIKSVDMLRMIVKNLPATSGAKLTLPGTLWINGFMRRDQYLSSITERYSEAWFSLMATFLGSADILGSPLGIVSNLSSGVKDFFEEPAKAIKNDPSQLGLAMAKGTAKLISKTVVLNVFGTTSKITSALSNVTSRASFDKKYLSERNLKSHIKPKHAGEGIAMGVMGLGRGIFDGVTGVITQPIKGAKEEGAVGLLKGFGKGIVGLAIKPSVGAIDLVSKSTEGIANTTHYLEKDKKIPRRPPRFIGERSVITVYDRYKSEGQKLMKTLNDGNFKDHVYYWHVVLAGEGKKATILMTQTNFFYIFKPPIKVGPTNYIIKYNLSYHYIERWFVNNSTSSLYIKLRSLPSSPSSRNITVQPQIKPAETPIPEAQYQNMIEIHCKELGVLQQIQKYLNLIIRGE